MRPPSIRAGGDSLTFTYSGTIAGTFCFTNFGPYSKSTSKPKPECHIARYAS